MTEGFLTTHVLDTANGCPAQGISIELYKLGTKRELIVKTITNSDGRCDQPLLDKTDFACGKYELVFHVASYFNLESTDDQSPPFLDEIVLRFGISERDQHYHVPLLVSPYSYSTYRGS